MPKDKGSRPLPPLSGIRFIVCPKCGIPTRPINTIDVVTFPDDVQVVEEIVAGEFNTFRHFCGEQISVVTPVVVTWAEKKLTLAVAAEDPTNGAGAERGWRLGHVEDYVGLQQVVIAWLAVDGNVLLTMLRDNSYFDLDRAGQIAAATPLRLLALSLEGRRRRASAQSPAEVKESEWFDGLATVVIAEFLRQLAIESAHNSVLNLIDIIRRAVPRQCLTPAVLDALRGACNDRVFASMPPDRDRLGVSFRAELVNAAAHVVADCDNPREVQWAIMIVSMWELSRRKQFYVDDRYFLDAVTCSRH